MRPLALAVAMLASCLALPAGDRTPGETPLKKSSSWWDGKAPHAAPAEKSVTARAPRQRSAKEHTVGRQDPVIESLRWPHLEASPAAGSTWVIRLERL